jgi:hypothetical protein
MNQQTFFNEVLTLPHVVGAALNLLGKIELTFMLSNERHLIECDLLKNTYSCSTYVPLPIEDYLMNAGFSRVRIDKQALGI